MVVMVDDEDIDVLAYGILFGLVAGMMVWLPIQMPAPCLQLLVLAGVHLVSRAAAHCAQLRPERPLRHQDALPWHAHYGGIVDAVSDLK